VREFTTIVESREGEIQQRGTEGAQRNTEGERERDINAEARRVR